MGLFARFKARLEEIITRRDAVRSNISSGADLCGPNPDVQTGETWRERSLDIASGAELPRSNALDITLTNVAAASFDLVRAGIDPHVEASLTITSDGPVAVTLSGLPEGQPVLVEDTPTTQAGTDGRATVELAGGQTQLGLARVLPNILEGAASSAPGRAPARPQRPPQRRCAALGRDEARPSRLSARGGLQESIRRRGLVPGTQAGDRCSGGHAGR